LAQAKTRRRVVRVQSKGQVTIPSEFREALGINAETLLSITMTGGHLELTPLREGDGALRSYTDSDISRFLEEDRLDEETARRVRDPLNRGDL
jgi:AbrB family looped-hinge helix DNA binding protein